jgi:hypothetical protein
MSPTRTILFSPFDAMEDSGADLANGNFMLIDRFEILFPQYLGDSRSKSYRMKD